MTEKNYEVVYGRQPAPGWVNCRLLGAALTEDLGGVVLRFVLAAPDGTALPVELVPVTVPLADAGELRTMLGEIERYAGQCRNAQNQ